MSDELKEKLEIYISDEEKQEIENLAKKNRISPSDLIHRAVQIVKTNPLLLTDVPQIKDNHISTQIEKLQDDVADLQGIVDISLKMIFEAIGRLKIEKEYVICHETPNMILRRPVEPGKKFVCSTCGDERIYENECKACGNVFCGYCYYQHGCKTA